MADPMLRIDKCLKNHDLKVAFASKEYFLPGLCTEEGVDGTYKNLM